MKSTRWSNFNLKDLGWALTWLLLGFILIATSANQRVHVVMAEIIGMGSIIFAFRTLPYFTQNVQSLAAINLISLLLVSLLSLQLNAYLVLHISMLVLSVSITDSLHYLIGYSGSRSRLLELGFFLLAGFEVGLILFWNKLTFLPIFELEPAAQAGITWVTFLGILILLTWFFGKIRGLVTAKHELDALTRETQWLRHFLGMINHQIRSPLAAAKLRFDMLRLKSSSTPLPENLKKDLETIESAQNQVIETANAFLKAVRFIELNDKMNLIDLVNSVRKEYQLAPLSPQKMPLLPTEGLSLKMALDAAIDNAFKYGAQHINVLVENPYMVKVVDDGPGMSQEQANQLGKRFKTKRSQQQTGTGMGMVLISKMLTEVDWTMTVKSTLGQGSTIIFSKTKT